MEVGQLTTAAHPSTYSTAPKNGQGTVPARRFETVTQFTRRSRKSKEESNETVSQKKIIVHSSSVV